MNRRHFMRTLAGAVAGACGVGALAAQADDKWDHPWMLYGEPKHHTPDETYLTIMKRCYDGQYYRRFCEPIEVLQHKKLLKLIREAKTRHAVRQRKILDEMDEMLWGTKRIAITGGTDIPRRIT